MAAPKTAALPLGYTPSGVDEGDRTLEDAGATIRCVNHFATTAIINQMLNNSAESLSKYGGYRARTCDPLLVRQTLSQLS